MNKKNIFLVLAFALSLGMAITLLYLVVKERELTMVKKNNLEQEKTPSPKEEVFPLISKDNNSNSSDNNRLISSEPLDANWNQYTNKQLGFSLKVPNQGDITILEDQDIVFIMDKKNSYFEEINQNLKSNKTEWEKVSGIPWAIIVKSVANDQELEKFIQNRYGKTCQLGEKVISSQTGIYDVVIKTDNQEPGEGCFLNWILFIKYDPQKGKVAAWDMGQDNQFISPPNSAEGADIEMMKSFKFL